MRVCKTCKEEKPISAFHKHKGYKDGIRPNCVPCRRTYESISFHKHKHKKPYVYEDDKDKKLQRAYGISYQDYLDMEEEQNGQCNICGDTRTAGTKAFAVDHCHVTGKVRSLLCSKCNTALGSFRDDVAMLQRAIDYLQFHKE